MIYKNNKDVKDIDMMLTFISKCTCCGREFESEDPKQDICVSCLSEIADLEQIDK